MLAEVKISMEDFRALVARAGLELTAEELGHLKPMYEYFAAETAVLHDLDLGAEGLAVEFSSEWLRGGVR